MRIRLFWLLVSILTAMGLTSALIAATGQAGPGEAARAVIISEIAWWGTAAGFHHEWMELHNPTDQAVDLSGWTLGNGVDINIPLSGVLSPQGFYLLEGVDEAVSDINADQLFVGSLSNSGESLTLRDSTDTIIDTANSDGGEWPAGEGPPNYLSMERLNPTEADVDENWISNNGVDRNGLDAFGGPINGTPRQPNSQWPGPEGRPDLGLFKSGPITVTAGNQLKYSLTFSNSGEFTATSVVLSDTLPHGFTYESDDSGLPLSQPVLGTLIWQVDDLPVGSAMTIHMTTSVDGKMHGEVTNRASIGGSISETNEANNSSQHSTVVIGQGTPSLLIDAVYFDSYERFEPDEAVRLINIGDGHADLTGWQISDGVTEATFPPGTSLGPGQGIWVSDEATSFARQFGHRPDYETGGSDPSVPEMDDTWPGFANDGDEVILMDDAGLVRDVLVYKDGNTSQPYWNGLSVSPYVVPSVFSPNGQILYRMRDQKSGVPVPDTNSAADWAQSTNDIIDGRRVNYPGWDLESFFFTPKITQTTVVTIGIAPDNGFELLDREFEEAQNSILVEAHSITSIALAESLSRAAARGITVTVLVEGGPVAGIERNELFACQLIETAGGQCWAMISNSDEEISDRYRYLHAKFMLIDDKRAIISSENLSPNSLPNDNKVDGTWGRRGVIFITQATEIVDRLRSIWQADFDPGNHEDLIRWGPSNPEFGSPGPGTVPITRTGGTTYTVRYPSPYTFEGSFGFELVQSPENSLRSVDGLLGLLEKAGAGDTILVQQLDERPHWGSGDSTPLSDPNPRLEAYLEAARRGAKVRILLDGFFGEHDDDDSNRATCDLVTTVAVIEKLDLACNLANPTGLGIHNKMILAQIQGQGYSFVGSINGTELSHKGNREVALLVTADEVFELWAEMFYGDWPSFIYLPAMFNRYSPPADHIIISEVLYDPSPREDAEFIELVNPTNQTIPIGNYRLGDAVEKDDFEDVRRFPSGTILNPDETVVVALTASGFKSSFGYNPDFEILNSDPTIPNLLDDPAWGDPAAILQLGNQGDEVLLRDPSGKVVDAIAYGSGRVPGIVSCSLVPASNYSLERYPYKQDTDDCLVDFRLWPLPNPGFLPPS